MMREVAAVRPAYVVSIRVPTSWVRHEGADARILDEMQTYLRDGYAPCGFVVAQPDGSSRFLWEAEATRAGIEMAKSGDHGVWITAGGRGGGGTGEINPTALRRLFADGADGVIVNDPTRALAVRAELGGRRAARLALKPRTSPAAGGWRCRGGRW